MNGNSAPPPAPGSIAVAPNDSRLAQTPSGTVGGDEGVRPALVARGARRLVWRVAFWIVLAFVVYVTFRPDSSVRTLPFGPKAVWAWFDVHDFVKNLVGFAVLNGVGCVAWWGVSRLDLPVALPSGVTVRLRLGWLTLALVVFVLASEAIQALWMSQRTGDWRDVAAGALAASFVSAVVNGFAWLTRRERGAGDGAVSSAAFAVRVPPLTGEADPMPAEAGTMNTPNRPKPAL